MKDFTEKDMAAQKLEKHLIKLRSKRNVMFRAALINYVALIVVWLISMTSFYRWAAATFMPVLDAANAQILVLGFIGLWEVLTIVFFLVPACAIWWEMKMCKKENQN